MRDLRLDFFRGLALFFIFVDHITGNILARFTLHAFAYCDGAEMFFFISGYTAAIAYPPIFARQGVVMGIARVYRRAWQLYVAHLALFVIVSAEVAYAVSRGFVPPGADEVASGDHLSLGGARVIDALTLQAQPEPLGILPTYIVLLLALPVLLLVMRRNVLLALVPSVLLWALAVTFKWDVPTVGVSQLWFFNPFTWQLPFVLGLSLSLWRGRLPWPRALVTVAIAVAVVICGLEVFGRLYGFFPRGLHWLAWLPTPYRDKPFLEPERIISFLALAVIVADRLRPNDRFFATRTGWLVSLCGKHSLEVFCLTIILIVPAEMLMHATDYSLPAQLAINAAGMALMVGLAILLAWYRSGGTFPRRRLKRTA